MSRKSRTIVALTTGFALSILASARANGQEFIPPDLDRLKPQQIQPLKPLKEIRFDHQLAARQGQVVPKVVTLQPTTMDRPPSAPKSVRWVASNLHYNQPYFEDALLERYGLSFRPVMQPAISAAHFFTTATVLPVLRHSCHRCEVFDHRGFDYLGGSNCQ